MKKYQTRNVLFIAEYQEYILLRTYYKQAKCTKENGDSQRHFLIWQLLLSIGWKLFRRSRGQIFSRSWKGAQENKAAVANSVSQGFALKKGTGKLVTFTAAQKKVMIEFYV